MNLSSIFLKSTGTNRLDRPIQKFEVKDDLPAIQMTGRFPKPAKKMVILSFFGINQNKQDDYIIIKNPSGSLLDGEPVTYIEQKNKQTNRIIGSTTGIVISERSHSEPDASAFLFLNKILNIKGRIVQQRSIVFPKREHNTPDLKNFSKFYFDALFSSQPTAYYYHTKFESIIINKIILLTDDQEYYAVDYIGTFYAPVSENTQIIIKEGILDQKSKVIIATKLSDDLDNDITKKLVLPFESIHFKKKLTWSGKINSVKIQLLDCGQYKDWIFNQSSLFRYDEVIKEFKKFFIEYCIQHNTKEFNLPVYFFEVDLDHEKSKITCIFRPIWYYKSGKENEILPLILPLEDDHITMDLFPLKSGLFLGRNIYIEDIRSFSFSTVDLDSSHYDDNPVLLQNDESYMIKGRIVTEPLTFHLGFDPNQVRLPEILNANFPNFFSQVVFRLKSESGQYIACKTYEHVFGGLLNTAIPKLTNLNIEAKGFFSFNGVFEIDEITVVN